MAELTMGLQVEGLKDLTKALDEFNHNRSYVDGLESWILRSEADNERLRERIEQLKQPARGVDGSTAVTISGLSGVINPDEIARAINESIRDQSERVERVDHWRTLAAWLEKEFHFTPGDLTAAHVIQLFEAAQSDVKKVRDEMNRVDAALGLSHFATAQREPGEPVHPRLWEIEKLKTTVPGRFDLSWHDLVEWAHKHLKVPEGDSTAPHILRALQDRAATLRKEQHRIAERNRALEFARGWFAGEFRNVTIKQTLDTIDKALQC